MAPFFPADSRLDVERAPSLSRRTSSRNLMRGASDDLPSSSRQSRPSHINWLQNSSAMTQAGSSTPRRPPSVRLSRSASLSALGGLPPTLHRQSSLISNHSLQLSTSTGPRTGNPAAASAQPTAKQLSPISERSYIPTPKREQYLMDVEPSTPVSIGSSYSAFLRRPLKRSISATSTSSLRTDATSTQPPVLPPLNISPLDMRPAYPPVSHRSGQQLVSTVYEDAGSERTLSFVTARSNSIDGEDADDTAVAPDADEPSYSTILSPSTLEPGNQSDAFADPDRATEGTTLAATWLGGSSSNAGIGGNGSGFGDGSSSSGLILPARPRPRRRAPTSGGSGSTSSTFIWRRWTRELSFGSSLSRPSFSAARRAIASRLPPLPILLFWAGFLAPWCWLIGGWLIEEGRWEDSGKARAALPLWKPRPHSPSKAKAKAKAKAKDRNGQDEAAVPGGGPQLPPDSLGKDLERGDAAVAGVAAQEGQASTAEGARGEAMVTSPPGGPRRFYAWRRWIPFAYSRHDAELEPSPDGEKVVTLVKPYSAEVWVYRCRLAAVLGSIVLLIALIVTVIVIGRSNRRR